MKKYVVTPTPDSVNLRVCRVFQGTTVSVPYPSQQVARDVMNGSAEVYFVTALFTKARFG